MNTPNKLTIFRVLLIPIILWLMYSSWEWSNLAALAVFLLAAVTDWLDGYIARKKNLITTFGKFMDPLADKLLVTAVFIALADFGYLSGIIAIIVISREFVVTGLRLVAVSEDKIIAANLWGKLKTVLQISVIIAFFINSELRGIIITYNHVILTTRILNWLIWIMTAVTVISGIDYVWKNRALLKMGGNK
ncbi:MAG: CDP-diacylglycerol--glycerol-3-phosphate 3-phosphatidyltransferase [Oscillospiraceae bacterium]|nr:CDP-diacylglycerol--glycerol-3-phosphate 3-phosphatidyltransferase [Oscillospiraceae bacterium]